MAWIGMMDLRRLQTFIAVAEEGSVSGASRRLHITQPALSRQLRDLQQELDLKLVQRVGRRLLLTGEGEQFLKHCRDLLNQAHALTEHAESLRKGSAGVLRVAASPQLIESVFPTFLRHYARRHPGVQVKPVEVLSSEQPAQLESGAVHMAINVMETYGEHFASYPLMSFNVLAAFNSSARIGEKGVVDIRKLAQAPLLIVNSGFGSRRLFDAACRLSRLDVHVFVESGSPHTLLALAEAGCGVAIVPSTVVMRNRKLRVSSILYRGQPIGGTVGILWDKRRSLPRYAAGFAEALAAHVHALFPKYRYSSTLESQGRH
jgi:DNA-binding transcriptional LysR family regulator